MDDQGSTAISNTPNANKAIDTIPARIPFPAIRGKEAIIRLFKIRTTAPPKNSKIPIPALELITIEMRQIHIIFTF